MISVIEAARSNQVKILPICSYAKKLMEGKDDFMDVLYDNDPVGPLLFISK